MVITYNLYSFYIFIKLTFIVIPLAILAIICFKYSKKRYAKKLSRIIRKDKRFANKFAKSLDFQICDIKYDSKVQLSKLQEINFPLIINENIIYSFSQLDENIFIAIVCSNYKLTAKANSNVLNLILYLKFIIDKKENRIVVYSNNDKNPRAQEIKKAFINELFKTQFCINLSLV